ncbi:MAG TPA: Fic family protein [Chitinophagaceae bacterium]|nr:Fic family protein [Chitinophagaceae bacterium]
MEERRIAVSEVLCKALHKLLAANIYTKVLRAGCSLILYFVVKNHSFADGNKRIGAFLFIWFLEKNKHRFKKTGELKINDNALTALTLLVAQSNPSEKELMIKLIINLIK